MIKTPYLVQRLRKNYGTFNELPASLKENYKTGYTCTPDERVMINDIFHLDYMGSAEFEFGAFPKAMKKLADTKSINNTVSWKMIGKPRGVFSDEIGTEEISELFVIVPKNVNIEELKTFIVNEANNISNVRLKEMSELNQIFGKLDRIFNGKYAMKYENKKADIIGWFDLDNLWFATTDEKLFNILKGLLYC